VLREESVREGEFFMYPKLIIDLKKLTDNLEAVANITKEEGACSLMIVTKGLCADPQMVKLVAEHKAVDFMLCHQFNHLRLMLARPGRMARKRFF